MAVAVAEAVAVVVVVVVVGGVVGGPFTEHGCVNHESPIGIANSRHSALHSRPCVRSAAAPDLRT